MATLEDGIIRVVDAAGVPINGGKLRIYNTGTTTLSTVWANAALSTPLTNPVVADSAGRLPQIFGADGLVVDCKMLTAANVELSDTAFTKSFSGDTSGDIYRDFTSARFQITKIAGEVEIEAGDPTGDDVGGTMRLGGWENTQADQIELDGALVNVTGKFKENSKKLDGVVYTARTAFSGATVDITLPNDPTGCLAWEIDFWDVITTGAANIYARLGYGGAVKSGASDYAWAGMKDAGTSLSVDAVSTHRDNLDAQMIINEYGIVGSSTYPLRIKLEIDTVASGSGPTTVFGRLAGSGGTYPQFGLFTGYGLGGYGTATTLELSLNAGSFTSGYYRVKPLRGWGET